RGPSLTGSPDESGRKRREKELARSGNGRVRRGMVQLAWRFLTYQKESALAQWYRARTLAGSQAHDRGLGTQATDRSVAVRVAGRCTGRRRFASGTMIVRPVRTLVMRDR